MTTSEPLTVDQKGVAPQNRFTDPSALFSAWQEAQREHLRNDIRLSDIRAIYDGLPPQRSDLSDQQQSELVDINRKEFQAKVDTYVSTWTDVDVGGERQAEVKAKHGDPTQKEVWSKQLTQFFNEAFLEWDEECSSLAPYLLEAAVRNTQMGLFGIGVAYFQDDIDWRWVTVPTRSVHVPTGTLVSLRNGSVVYVQREYTATQLYDLREKDGWNRAAILELLYNRTAETSPGTTHRIPFAEWENRLRNNETTFQRDFKLVHVVHAYVQEFNTASAKDAVSHYVIAQDGPNTEFLFEKDRQYASFSRVLIPFVDNPGPEGDWHGVKGFGDLIFDQCHFNNLFWNHIATTALITSTPIFQSETEADRQKLAQIVWSRMGVLAPGLNLLQTKVNADLNGCMSVLTQGERLMNTNTRLFPQGEANGMQEKTATQATFDRQDQAQFTSLQVRLYRTLGLDRLFTEMYRRLSRPASDYPEAWPGGKAAANFRRKCQEAQIPEKCWQEVAYVRASRSGGSGNMGLDVMKAKEAMNVATPGLGQLNARKELVAALYGGWDRVAEFVQDAPVVDDQDKVIALENALLTAGQLIPAFPQEDHEKHLGTPEPQGSGHLSILAATRMVAMQLQQSGLETNPDDAQKLSRTMDAALAHCQQHAQFLASMPSHQESAKQLGQVLNAFGSFVQAFDQELGKALQQAQPQGPQMSMEDQIRLQKWQVEKQILIENHQLDMQLRADAQNQKLGDLAERHHAKQTMQEQQFNQKLGLEAEASLAQRHMQGAEHQQTLAANAAETAQDMVHGSLVNQQELDHLEQLNAQTRAANNLKKTQQNSDQ